MVSLAYKRGVYPVVSVYRERTVKEYAILLETLKKIHCPVGRYTLRPRSNVLGRVITLKFSKNLIM